MRNAGYAPPWEREKITSRMMVRTWTDWNLIWELLGASGLEEGAMGAVGK
jgi:hypothetical protein